MDISLGRVIDAARARQAAFTSEVAGYVVLLAAQQLEPERSGVSPESVLLGESGAVEVLPHPPASELEVESALRGLLATLIALSPSPPPAIRGVAERGANGDLAGLIAELSAALIPINHAAAHRALARLYRETQRARGPALDAAPAPLGEPSLVAERSAIAEVGEVEIDILIESEETCTASSFRSDADHLAVAAAAEPAPQNQGLVGSHSDLRELLGTYLPEARSLELMVRALREMIGLELRAPRAGRGTSDMSPIAAVSTLNGRVMRDWPA